MKKKRILPAVLAALALTLTVLVPGTETEAEPSQQHNMAEIVGIDYDRITQKAGGGKKSAPVELKLGDVSFTGELTGDFGLSYEELNQIIRQTLEEKDLTAERVALVAKIAARAQKDAKLYWGEQVLEGLLSYLSVPGTAISVSDYYELIVHGNVKPAAKAVAVDNAKAAAKSALKAAAGASGKVGRVAKALSSGGGGGNPLTGAVTNTAKVAYDWTQGSKRFDDYMKLLEENLAVINDFYAACSRRAVALADSKDITNTWKIRFDARKNYRTYNATFWDIPGNMMSVKLSGELVNDGKEAAGTYSGTLWLDFEAVDLSPMERNLEKTGGLRAFYTLLHSTGGYKKTFDSGDKAVLRREVQGVLSVTVSETNGTVKPKVSGSLTSGGDETTFEFGRHITWRDETWASMGSIGVTEAWFITGEIDSISMESSSRVEYKGTVQTQKDSNETFAQDPGTIFAPLGSAPEIVIRFSP